MWRVMENVANGETRNGGACGMYAFAAYAFAAYAFAVLAACLIVCPAWAADPDRIQLAQFCPPGPMYSFCINQYQQQQRMQEIQRQQQQQEIMRQQQIQMQQEQQRQLEIQRAQQLQQQRQAGQQHRIPQEQNVPAQGYRSNPGEARAPAAAHPVQQPNRNASARAYSYNGQTLQPFNASPYRWPHGVKPRRYKTGELLPRLLRAADYIINNWSDFGLDDPGADYEWIRCGTDILLIDPNDGEVMDTVPNGFVENASYSSQQNYNIGIAWTTQGGWGVTGGPTYQAAITNAINACNTLNQGCVDSGWSISDQARMCFSLARDGQAIFVSRQYDLNTAISSALSTCQNAGHSNCLTLNSGCNDQPVVER